MTTLQLNSSQQSTSTPVSDLDDSHITDHGSGDDQPDDNFISMLQYNDAYHILGLSKSSNPDTAAVLQSYNALQKQTLSAFNAAISGGGGGGDGSGGAFLISRQNYLELKLQALDQAIMELIPEEAAVILKEIEEDEIEEDEGEDDIFDVDLNVPTNKLPKKGGLVAKKAEDACEHNIHGNKRYLSVGKNNKLKKIPPKLSPNQQQKVEKPSPKVTPKNAQKSDLKSQNHRPPAAQPSPQQVHPPQNPPKHKREKSIEKLETIDIYFRPKQTTARTESPPLQQLRSNTPSPSRYLYAFQDESGHRGRSKSPSHDSVSGITWDGPSDSLIYNRGLNTEDASEGGLSDVLGPLNQQMHEGTHHPRLSGANPSSTTESNPSQKKKQSSPRSVVDFPPSFEQENQNKVHNNNKPQRSLHPPVHGKHSNRRPSAGGRPSNSLSHEATEAARMGVLRALSEDDSECLTWGNSDNEDEDDRHIRAYRQSKSRRQGGARNLDFDEDDPQMMEFERSVGLGGDSGGKYPTRPMDGNNILVNSITNSRARGMVDGSRGGGSTNQQGRGTRNSNMTNNDVSRKNNSWDNTSKNTSPANSVSSASTRNNSKSTSDNNNTRDEEDYYETLLQSGIELAGEMCMAFNNCWNSVTNGNDTNNQRIESNKKPMFSLYHDEFDLDTTRDTENDTYDSRADNTANTPSTMRSRGEDESTAFYTMSSFSKDGGGARDSSPEITMRKSGMSSGNESGHKPKRMYL